jgi:predicted ATP-dependent serine protease
MAKTSTSFFCKNCGASSSKWVGKCNSCGEWNTYVEEVIHKEKLDYIPQAFGVGAHTVSTGLGLRHQDHVELGVQTGTGVYCA